MTQEVQTPPTLDEAGLMGEVDSILDEAEAQAKSVVSEPTERWKQKSNLITNDGNPLPERVRVWRYWTGAEAWLPTAQIRHHMQKEVRGHKAFVRSPDQVHESVRNRKPLDQSCDVCAVVGVHKKFYQQFDYERHMNAFHPQEWEAIQRDEERRERREDREMMQAALQAGVATKPKKQAAKCPVCNDFYVSKAHRAHKEAENGDS